MIDIDKQKTFNELIGNIGDTHSPHTIRQQSVDQLACLDHPGVLPFLLEFSNRKENDWMVRQATIEALGGFRNETVVDALSAFLDDSHDVIQQSAIKAAARLGGPRLVPKVCALLGSDSVFVRWNAAKALGEMGDLEALPALAKALKSEYPNPNNKSECENPNKLVLDHILHALEELLKRCRDADEFGAFEDAISGCRELADKASTDVLSRLKSIETEAREKRKKCAPSKDVLSSPAMSPAMPTKRGTRGAKKPRRTARL